ncbi:MAG: succinylglutamate desuccinylase [Sphaerobacteraceae bacterium]|nr:MAG: succinylglutamate desuccinylase [Sphaerobacteraceae bacterium]
MLNQTPWKIADDLAPGSKHRLELTFPDTVLDGVAIPATVIRGQTDGPRIAVISGVHGGEYPGPAAAIRLAREIDPAGLSGSLVIVPVVNQTAFWQRTAFVTPDDGINLNRVFPGDLNGTFSEVLARRLFDALVEPADILIDLHSGDIFESLTPFSGYYKMSDESLQERSATVAHAFMLPIVNAYPEPFPGSLTSAAARAGVASAIVEVGGNGLLSSEDEAMVFDGLINALRAVNSLDEPARTVPQAIYEPVNSADAPAAGLWRPAVGLNQQVYAGERLGTLTDLYGDEIADIVAPEAGEVVFYMTCLPVHTGDTLVALGRSV